LAYHFVWAFYHFERHLMYDISETRCAH